MFSKFFINRPIFATVISLVIVLAGLVCVKNLSVEEYPRLTPPQVSVSTIYSGADAQNISQSVASVLEEQINGVDNMIYIQSTSSSSGMMNVSVYFKVGTDVKQALIDVNNRVQTAISMLPDDVKKVGLTVRERGSSILGVVAFTNPNMVESDLNSYLSSNIIDELKRIKGVGDINVVGNKNYAMRIWLDPDKLNRYKISTNEVVAAIKEQNNQYQLGKLGENFSKDSSTPYVYSINSKGKFSNVDEFKNIILRVNPNNSFIRLKDVAKIVLGSQNYSVNAFLDNKKMIPALLFLQNGANAIETMGLVKKKLDELSVSYPLGLEHHIPYDTTKFVSVSIKEVLKTFAEAMIFVSIVMYMFLKSFRATIIPMLAVPVSIIGTFAGFYIMGFSINLITLFALILSIGIVVDDAIIVIENVERIMHEEKDISVKDATVKAMQEVSVPIVSIVLVLCAVFIPVSFMDGFIGVIQRQFALTLVISVCLSGLVALTLTPSLCSVILKKKEEEPFYIVKKFNDFFDYSTSIFSKGVAKILNHAIPSLIVVFIMFCLTFFLFKSIPHSLVPYEDKGAAMAITYLPPASNPNKTVDEVKSISSILRTNKNVEHVTSIAGYDIMSGSLKENAAISFIGLKDWSKRESKKDQIYSLIGPFNMMLAPSKQSLSFVVNIPPIMGLSLTGGFDMFLQYKGAGGYKKIQKDVNKVVGLANARPELVRVRTTLNANYPVYDIEIDEDKAYMLGISKSAIYQAIHTTIGGYYVNDFSMKGKNYRVYIRAKEEFRDNQNALRYISVKSKNGSMVWLDSIVNLKRSLGPDVVDRFNLFPAAKIVGEPAPGYTSSQALSAIEDVVKSNLDDDYSISWSGTSYQEKESSGKGNSAFIYGIVFVFLILAAQYERWLIPLCVITAVPFAVFGSLVATYFRGLSNDVYFQVGLLLLVALSAKNAILIVEFAMSKRDSGFSIKEAAREGSRLRFRPIVMTSLAFAFGILPMVFSSGAGAASRHSLSTGLLGGMIAATTIAIFFVPLFYYLLEVLNSKFHKKDF